jgi:hypothetical protein
MSASSVGTELPMYTELLAIALPAALLAGLVYASWEDWRSREVADGVWRLLAAVGAVGGAIALLGGSAVGLLAWGAVAALVLEHLFPWDAGIERRSEALPGYLELGGYGAVTVLLIVLGAEYGIGDAGLPVSAIAVYVSVLFARTLFEVGVLYGGADAKALMTAGLVVPLAPRTLLAMPAHAVAVLAYYPFSLNLLMDAALVAVAVPLAIAVRNVRRGVFQFPRGFTSYVLPTERLDSEFVWLRDPVLAPSDDEAATTEEDRALRRRQRAELEARGVRSVWVTPQLPFLLLLTAGAVLAFLVGNVVFDVAAAL